MTSEEEQVEIEETGPMTPGRLPEPSPAPSAADPPESTGADEDDAVSDAMADTWDG